MIFPSMTRHRFLHVVAGALTALAVALPSHLSAAEAPRAGLSAPLAPMPESVTSFAAVTAGRWLYVAGGHRGERHAYDAEHVSGSLHRLDLEAPGAAWERLADSVPAQGFPLVTHDGAVIRTGGMAAVNAPGATEDLRSLADALRYDPGSGQWTPLPPLPSPRSSHDAVVVGDRLYVGGGWGLTGRTADAVWHDSVLVLDLGRPADGWQSVDQPFRRRALAMATDGRRIWFIGGMDDGGKPSLAVDVLDTVTGGWSKGPDLPAGRFKGFACSAVGQAGRIYANMFQGDLLRLSAAGDAWEKVGRLARPRMAHRLVTAGPAQLIALGGEDGESKAPDLELLTPSEHPVARAE